MDEELSAGGRYVVQQTIGQGGAGAVYIAWDQQLGRHVAIKRIREDAQIEASIRKEAAILASLNHPNVVSIHDFAQDAQGPFVVMEYVEGKTLDDIAEESPLSVPAFLELANQLCRGLSAAHERGLLHLDLKPGNIMMVRRADGSFTAKILDFGLAKLGHEISVDNEEIVGSPHSVAPEQLRSEPVDQRTDIYSLGCVFYYALTGKQPFDGADVQDVLRAHLEGAPKPLHVLNTTVPDPLSRAVMKMIAREPSGRPNTAEEARASLQHGGRAPAAKRPGTPGADVYRPGRGKQKTGVNLPLILGAAILLIVGGYFGYRQLKPAATAPPEVATATPSPGPVADTVPSVGPLDFGAFAARKNQVVRVEGEVAAISESTLFHAQYLRFSASDEKALVVSVPNDKMSSAQALTFVGKRIRAKGTLTTAANVNRVVLEGPGDIEVLPPK